MSWFLLFPRWLTTSRHVDELRQSKVRAYADDCASAQVAALSGQVLWDLPNCAPLRANLAFNPLRSEERNSHGVTHCLACDQALIAQGTEVLICLL